MLDASASGEYVFIQVVIRGSVRVASSFSGEIYMERAVRSVVKKRVWVRYRGGDGEWRDDGNFLGENVYEFEQEDGYEVLVLIDFHPGEKVGDILLGENEYSGVGSIESRPEDGGMIT